MSTKLFTSDLHFGHERVAEIRGFPSALTHDLAVLASLQARVTKRDDLYVLGDLVGRSNSWLYALHMMRDVRARSLHLILGNHDPAHPAIGTRHGRYMREALEVFDTVAPFGTVGIGKGRKAVLSHFPYERERGGKEPRWAQWRLKDEGAVLLHGHTHETARVQFGRREIHVGWDAWRRPVTLDEIRERVPVATGEKSPLTPAKPLVA